MTTSTITVDLAQKTVSYSADVTIRETVSVVIAGASQADVAGLLLRVIKPDDQSEMAICSSFSSVGQTFVGELDLSGALLALEFLGDSADKMRSFQLQVINNTAGNLIINDRMYIMNNPLTAAIQAEVLTGA